MAISIAGEPGYAESNQWAAGLAVLFDFDEEVPNTFAGSVGGDALYGTSQTDTIEGSLGDDTITTSAGDDTVRGGKGQDRLEINTRDGDTAIVDLDARSLILTEATALGATVHVQKLVSIEDVAGGLGRDALSGTGGANVLDGLGGDDVLSELGGADLLDGGDGKDQLSGGRGSDTLDGGRGSDVLRGGKGDEVITGGLGEDTFEFVTGPSGFFR